MDVTWALVIIVRMLLFALAIASTWDNVNDMAKRSRLNVVNVTVNGILWAWFIISMGGFGVVPE
jgi:hypothetical protein